MKLEISVFSNENEVFVKGYMAGNSFYENASTTAKRIPNGKAHIETECKTFMYDENHTEGEFAAVDIDTCCNLKTLAICELIKAMTYDYCLPETIVIKNIRK